MDPLSRSKHVEEIERLEARVAELELDLFAARDAVLTEGQARIELEARVAALTAAIRAVKQYTEQEPTANYGGAVTLSPEWFRMLAALDAAAGG